MHWVIPIMLVAGLLLTVFSMAFFSVSTQNKKCEISKALAFAYDMRNAWFRSEMLWMYVDYEMTAISFVSSMLVVYIMASGMPIEEYRVPILIYSIVGAGIALLNYAVNPKRQALAYRKAYLKISGAINRYHLNSTNDAASETLYQAIQSGEEEITVILS